MLEIDVFIGLNTVSGFSTQPPVLVSPDTAAAHSGDDIVWNFHSMDDAVNSVVVTFADKGDKFFRSRNQTSPTKKCFAYLYGKSKTGKGKHGRLLGTAPSLGSRNVKPSKYTIDAYSGKDGKGTKLYTLDPVVVTCDP
jgi:hypothetical protein